MSSIIKLRNLLFLPLVFMFYFSSAQNWLPVKSGLQSNFSCDTSRIFFSIKVDSVDFNNGDTIYYLNRVVRPCDTCSQSYKNSILQIYSNSFSNNFYLINQPQFLQRKIIRIDSLKIMLVDTADNVILPFNSIGVPWVYDTVQNITAQISERIFSNVLGLPDSLETILLSNGDSIVLSRSYGVVKYPAVQGANEYYRLVGLEGLVSAGTKIPGFMDFFNFNVGDEFGYDYWKLNPGEEFSMNDHFVISQKYSFQDSVSYTVNGNWNGVHLNYNVGGVITYHNSFVEQMNYYIENSLYYYYHIDEEEPWVRFYVDFYDKKSFELINVNPYSTNSTDYLFSFTFFNDSIHRISKETNSQMLYLPGVFDTSINNELLLEYDVNSSNTLHCMVSEGMGYNFIAIYLFENTETKNTIFCVINGDTLSNHLTNLPEKISERNIKVFPNPVDNFVYISGMEGSAIITLFNSTNNIVQINKFFFSSEKEQHEISLKPMASGFYFLKIETEKGIYFRKIIKK